MRLSMCIVVLLVVSTCSAQLVHFGSTNAGTVSASDTGGASWTISIKGPSGSLPSQADVSALYDAFIAPASGPSGVCALSGSFTSRAVRLALACPADATVLENFLTALRGQCAALPQPCNVTSEANVNVNAHHIETVVMLSGDASETQKRGTRPSQASIRASSASGNTGVRVTSTTQLNVRWGLDRIKSRPRVYDNTYVYDATGSGSDIWIVDTGVRTSHSDFGGRATWVGNTVDSEDSDCNGTPFFM